MSPEIQQFLTDQGVRYALHSHAPIVSFTDAIAALPFDPSAMVKGLAFRLPSGAYLIAAMRGGDRADYKKIADAAGVRRADLRAAEADDIVGDLGMVPGGISPLPINGATVMFDEAVAGLATVFCGAGRTDTTLEIAGPDLLRIAGGRVAPLTRPG